MSVEPFCRPASTSWIGTSSKRTSTPGWLLLYPAISSGSSVQDSVSGAATRTSPRRSSLRLVRLSSASSRFDEHAPRHRCKGLADRRRRNFSRRAVQQADADAVFQLLDQARERRLRQVHGPRGFREARGLQHGDIGAQLPQCHIHRHVAPPSVVSVFIGQAYQSVKKYTLFDRSRLSIVGLDKTKARRSSNAIAPNAAR